MIPINPVLYIPPYTANAPREGMEKGVRQGAIVSIAAGSALVLATLFSAVALHYGLDPSFFSSIGSFSSAPTIAVLVLGGAAGVGGIIAVVVEKKVHARVNKELIKNTEDQRVILGQLREEKTERLYYSRTINDRYLIFVKNGKNFEVRGYRTEKQFLKAQKALQEKGILPTPESFVPSIDKGAQIIRMVPLKKKTGF